MRGLRAERLDAVRAHLAGQTVRRPRRHGSAHEQTRRTWHERDRSTPLYVCCKATRVFRDLDVDDAAQEVENLFKEWEPGDRSGRVLDGRLPRRHRPHGLVRRAEPGCGAGRARRVRPDAAGRALECSGRSWASSSRPSSPRITRRRSSRARRRGGTCTSTRSSARPSGTCCRGTNARLLREHGEIGREFPDVLANTTSAFGMNDWEWILAFEADELDRMVECIRTARGGGPPVHEGGGPVRDGYPQGRARGVRRPGVAASARRVRPGHVIMGTPTERRSHRGTREGQGREAPRRPPRRPSRRSARTRRRRRRTHRASE